MRIYHQDVPDYNEFTEDGFKRIVKQLFITEYDLEEQTKELKRIKHNLEKLNSRLLFAFKNMHEPAIILEKRDRDYYILSFNNRASNLDKLTEKDIGRNIKDVYKNIEKYNILDVFDRVYDTDNPEKHYGYYEFDGYRSGYRDNYIYRIDVTENCYEIILISIDVTNIKDVYDAFYTMFNTSNCPSCILNLDNFNLKDVNESFCNFLKYERGELINNSLFKLNILYDIENEFSEKIKKDNSIKDYYVTGIDKNGDLLEAYLNGSIIKLDGKPYLLAILLPKDCKQN